MTRRADPEPILIYMAIVGTYAAASDASSAEAGPGRPLVNAWGFYSRRGYGCGYVPSTN